jgi:drug/metabolite transporter (DMT)-like permease
VAHANSSPVDPLLVRRARLLLVGTTVLWGLSFPLIRALELAQRDHAPHASDSTMACADMAMRFGAAALFLLPFYGRGLSHVTGREWSQSLGLALFAGIGICLQTLGLAWSDASIAAFLTQLYTLIVPLIVAVRDRRAPTLRVIVACVLVLTGAAMLSPGLLRHFILGAGELAVLLSTGFLACQIVWVERPLYEKNRPGVVTLVMFLSLTAMFALGFLLTGGTTSSAGRLFDTPALALLSLAIVLLCTVTNFLIMNAWQRRLSATEAGLIYCIEPVIAALLSSFLPGWLSHLAGITYANETLSWSLLAGGLLIVIATILVATEPKKLTQM